MKVIGLLVFKFSLLINTAFCTGGIIFKEQVQLLPKILCKSEKYRATVFVPCFICFNFKRSSNICEALPRPEYILRAAFQMSVTVLKKR
ncbi:hypothetical protein Dimus_038984 [Dionaea muscipula]